MKKSVVSLMLATACLPALPAQNGSDRLIRCADIQESRDRLACFDREVAPLVTPQSRPAPPPAPAPPAPVVKAPPVAAPVVAAPAPSAPAPAARSFGEEQLQRKDRAPEPEDQQSLHARIERIRTVTASDFIVYLDNGQAWRHQDIALGAYLRVGEAITISKGTLGSYRLTRDAGNSKNWIRVSRIR
jgi:hypothetical protein